MRTVEILGRLERISPMPSDEEVSDELLQEYEEIIEILQENDMVMDSQVLKSLVNAFGYGEGFGLYWSAVHLLEKSFPQQLTPFLVDAIQNGSPGARMWSVILLGRMRNSTFLPYIAQALKDEQELVRLNALIALETINDISIVGLIEDMKSDASIEVQTKVKQILGNWQS